MTVHIGEMVSEVEVQGGRPAAPGPGGGGGEADRGPSWQDEERHRLMAAACRRARARTAAEGFDFHEDHHA